jgi:hypothetical protein
MTTTDFEARIKTWTDRVRAACAAEQAFLAAATAYYETPTPADDPWHADYVRTLGHAERDKAEAAGSYAEQAERVLSQLLDEKAAAEMNADAAAAAPGVYGPGQLSPRAAHYAGMAAQATAEVAATASVSA